MENWGKMFFAIQNKAVQFQVPDLSAVEFQEYDVKEVRTELNCSSALQYLLSLNQ
jgi:hypothetical protein